MRPNTLIVPGYQGSGPAHWQSWLERSLPGSQRVTGIDWNAPCLSRWSHVIAQHIQRESRPIWLVAHSFGCLAVLVAAQALSERVAGVMLVAPADPERFDADGLRRLGSDQPNLVSRFETIRLALPGVVVASTTDPWMNFATANYWARTWGLPLQNAGDVGHLNTEAGFGPWPAGRDLLVRMQATDGAFLLGPVDTAGLAA